MDAYQQIYPILAPLVNGEAYPEHISERENGGNQPIPYIIFTEISTDPEITLDGFLGHEYSRIQIDVYHQNIDKCHQLVKRVLWTINKQLPNATYLGRRRLPDPDTKLARQSLDYKFFTTTE